ncbi:hypothetical protein ACLOJK_034897 [Asimina triloba]
MRALKLHPLPKGGTVHVLEKNHVSDIAQYIGTLSPLELNRKLRQPLLESCLFTYRLSKFSRKLPRPFTKPRCFIHTSIDRAPEATSFSKPRSRFATTTSSTLRTFTCLEDHLPSSSTSHAASLKLVTFSYASLILGDST